MKAIAATGIEAVFRTAHRISQFAVFWIGLTAGVAGAQQLPEAPAKPATPPAIYYGDYDWIYRAGVACGGGASESSGATKPAVQCGAILGLSFLEIEIGAMGPTANHNGVSGYLSTNAWVPLVRLRDVDKDMGNKHGVPVAIGGYTQRFGASNALNYGVGYVYPVDEGHAIQFEARDYWTYASPSEHNVVFRVSWLLCIPDP